MSFAEKTKVPIAQSQNEIQRTLEKYGATGFGFAQGGGFAVVMFAMSNRQIHIKFPLCEHGKATDSKNYFLSQEQCARENRRLWRCLVLTIKAKLECVESGITTLEEEFLAHIVLPNGRTVGKEIRPRIEESYRSGKMPPLLGMD